MKKHLLFTFIAAMIAAFASAQAKRIPQHQQVQGGNTFGLDVTIQPAGIHQLAVKLTTAFNGWQYAMFSTYDSLNIAGGFNVMSSRDNGATWSMIYNESNQYFSYPAFDIVVAGTDTNHLKLFFAYVENLNDFNLGINASTVIVDELDARTDSNFVENFTTENDSGPIRDIAIASDYAFPASAASPYSVGVLYSSSYLPTNPATPSADTVVFVASLDSGATWGVKQVVAVDASGLNYYRNLDIAYGHSASLSNGSYFGAWESVSSLQNRTGSIYTSHSSGMISNPWITPVNLDSLNTSTAGLCRNPCIAVSVGSADNDSGSVTAVVLVDRDSLGDGSNYNVLGFYNKVANSTNFWNRLNIANTAENDMQPDIAFCTGTSSFVCTYFDSTNQALPYAKNNVNLATPNTWNFVTNQYNDLAANLITPLPQISVDQSMNTSAFAWIQSNGSYLQAMFDAENSTVNVPESKKLTDGLMLFPNPAIHDINVSVNLTGSSRIRVDIYNSFGQLMIAEDLGTLDAGNSNHTVNIDALDNGNYFVRVTGDRFVKTEKLVIMK